MEVSNNPYLLQQLFREGIYILPSDLKQLSLDETQTAIEEEKVEEAIEIKENNIQEKPEIVVEEKIITPAFTHKLLIILEAPLDPNGEERTLLANIIKALKVPSKEIAVHYANQQSLPEQLAGFVAPNVIAFLGQNPEANLGFSGEAYEVANQGDFWLLWSDTLFTLEKDQSKKLLLWQQLKKRFLER